MRKFADPKIKTAFDAFPSDVRSALLDLREIILQAAADAKEVGGLVETLKWGQPSYLPSSKGTGTTVRLGAMKNAPDRYAMFFHCQTDLVETFRGIYGDTLSYEGNRAIVFSCGEAIPREALAQCVTLALTYHARKTRKRPAGS
ncbi:MAG: DUF1801 domain-containing protein [Alphaproteobacteria bacterium]|nr:DUF1801 domain-containing protein [Alphaproteobacteria bacterium]